MPLERRDSIFAVGHVYTSDDAGSRPSIPTTPQAFTWRITATDTGEGDTLAGSGDAYAWGMETHDATTHHLTVVIDGESAGVTLAKVSGNSVDLAYVAATNTTGTVVATVKAAGTTVFTLSTSGHTVTITITVTEVASAPPLSYSVTAPDTVKLGTPSAGETARAIWKFAPDGAPHVMAITTTGPASGLTMINVHNQTIANPVFAVTGANSATLTVHATVAGNTNLELKIGDYVLGIGASST